MLGDAMTDKAKRWFYVFLGLIAVYFLFTFQDFNAATTGAAFGATIGALFGGGLVALVLRFFWKKHTLYELWFASTAIWFGIYLVAQILGIQR